MPKSASRNSSANAHALRLVGAGLVGLAIHAVAFAQPAAKPKGPFGADTVAWSLSAPAGEVKPGAKIKLVVKGAVVEGWHIYALEQGSRGPIPLSVDIDKNAVAASDGVLVTTPPVKAHDKSFGFETQFTVNEDALDLASYRRRYATYKMDEDLKAAHAAAPWLVIWDDHEVSNNYGSDWNPQNMAREDFLLRRAAGYQAWYEHMPVRKSSAPIGLETRIYRSFNWGMPGARCRSYSRLSFPLLKEIEKADPALRRRGMASAIAGPWSNTHNSATSPMSQTPVSPRARSTCSS